MSNTPYCDQTKDILNNYIQQKWQTAPADRKLDDADESKISKYSLQFPPRWIQWASCSNGVSHCQVLAAHHDVPLQQLSWLQHKVKLVRLSRRDVAARQRHWVDSVDRSSDKRDVPCEQHLLNCRRADGLQTLVDSQEKTTSWKVREPYSGSRLCLISNCVAHRSKSKQTAPSLL